MAGAAKLNHYPHRVRPSIRSTSLWLNGNAELRQLTMADAELSRGVGKKLVWDFSPYVPHQATVVRASPWHRCIFM